MRQAKKTPVRNTHKATQTKKTTTRAAPKTVSLTPEERQRMTSEAAYFLAERRGFGPGQELGDWLQAEQSIASRLSPRP